MVSGTDAGVGKDLDSEHAKVSYTVLCIAASSEEKALNAIELIKAAHRGSRPRRTGLRPDLANLITIKASPQEFLSKETKFHVLFNMAARSGMLDQGYELRIGQTTSAHSFAELLTPILISTAKIESPSTVRIVWVSSYGAGGSPRPGGVGNLDYKKSQLRQSSDTLSAKRATTCMELNMRRDTRPMASSASSRTR